KTLWAGNVEIHLKASDWNRHGHQSDPLYRNTILHVVAENDMKVINIAGSTIPTLEIGWPLWIEYNYKALMQQHDWVNCASQLNKIDPFRIRFFLNGLAIERLQQKIGAIEGLLDSSNNDWSETFYRLSARSFGFRQNGDPFERLARSLPQAVLLKHHDQLFQLEALLFGQAGLLHEQLLMDEYPLSLRKEYEFLSVKYGLRPMAGHLWKFMRMHPLNFPTIRLAQFAGILHGSPALFPTVIQQETVADYRSLFRTEISTFWDTHYTFLRSSKNQKKGMGEEAFQLILVNVLAPFLFLYGDRNNKSELKERALKILEELPSENNTILRHWASAGIISVNALESQALIHLHHEYCETRRCLECSIGQKLIMHSV
ncbi:MAG: DUF2851 family protein, partial [Bacteroidetes bacterium]|nr:DUF2851 family protein [Bacteroidota bacterium]